MFVYIASFFLHISPRQTTSGVFIDDFEQVSTYWSFTKQKRLSSINSFVISTTVTKSKVQLFHDTLNCLKKGYERLLRSHRKILEMLKSIETEKN